MVLEIATGDDAGAGEKIVARQYNTSNAVAHEAQLLGTNGVTTFPVSVTAPIFNGDLNGNATSATKATQDGDGNVITSTYATKTEMNGIVAAADAMVFKGTLNGAATTTYTPAASRGWTYKVAAAGLINGERVEVGDILICTADSTAAATSSNVSTVKANWAIVQNNVDGAVFKSTNTFTDGQVLVADGTNGKIKTSGFTIAKSVPSNAVFTDTNYYHTTGS